MVITHCFPSSHPPDPHRGSQASRQRIPITEDGFRKTEPYSFTFFGLPPAFSKPISYDLLVEKPDNSEGMQRIEVRAKMAASPWRRCWWNYDHTKSLRSLTCPTLVIFAGRDLQTPPRCHEPNVRAALAGNPLAKVIELQDLNHFMQPARTGAVSEYGDIDQTLAPEAIEVVCDWLARVIAA